MRLLANILNRHKTSKVKHYVGMPPELAGGKETRQELGRASFLVIEENSHGVFLFRYGADGAFGGDTWHMNVDDAKHQASYEYGDAVEEWVDVPPDVEDAVAYGLSRLAPAQ